MTTDLTVVTWSGVTWGREPIVLTVPMRLCERCGSDRLESTCIGSINATPQERWDANRHTCMDCGHVRQRKS